MFRLVVAEKPSVAKVLSGVLGAKTKREGYYEGNSYIISWCVGHLLELAMPQDYDEKYAKWRYSDLPIIPKEWKYLAVPKTKKQLKILTDLMKRSDVDSVVNAADCGREGELIFKLVYEHCRSKKPVYRLWISSIEESAILDGFKNLRPGADYDRLYKSALCRQQADWLVGMNYSRLFSILYDAQLSVGRVQTPTLAMIVEREQKINGFVKEPFYTVEISDSSFTAEREKVKDKCTAEAISTDCNGKTAVVKSVKKQEKSISPPKLFDLTTLQREAHRLFGYTAAQTLECAQTLYELKAATYPRTDSRFITDDMAAGITGLVTEIAGIRPFSVGDISVNAAQIVNNEKVSDHHAILPASGALKVDMNVLPTAAKNILMMICTRLISAVSERHIYAETAVTLECGGEIFTAKGKTVVKNGWKGVEQAFAAEFGKPRKDEDKSLPELFEGQTFSVKSSVREGFTQPPKYYSEDLLLAAMETAGGDEISEMAERRGLGTPATRSNIIEGLINSKLIERKDKALRPTEKGVNLIKILPDSVKSPMLTAEWENNLLRVQKGELTDYDFMVAINKFVSDTVKIYGAASEENKSLFPSSRQKGEVIGKCPRCSGDISESPKGFFCSNNGCTFGLFKDNKFFTMKKKTITKEIASALLSDGRIFMSGLASEKTGKTYSATIILDDKGEGYPGFRMEFEKK